MSAATARIDRPVMDPRQKRMQTIQAVLYVLAIVLGLINGFYGSAFWIQAGEFISTIFIRLFRFIAVPIIAVSIIATLSQISRNRESGRIFKHSVFYTLLTTILAASLAAVLFEILRRPTSHSRTRRKPRPPSPASRARATLTTSRAWCPTTPSPRSCRPTCSPCF